MRDQLDKIENRLQTLLEENLSGLFSWGNSRHTLVHELVGAMQSSIITSADGRMFAPNVFIIQVHPDRLPYWQANPVLLEELARQLTQAAGEAEIEFVTPPGIQVAANPSLPEAGIRVVPSIRQDPVADTAALQAAAAPVDNPTEPAIPPNAFLIINGSEVYALRQGVVNIGRRLDNHLSIDDPRVSRTHAQLRAIRGQYVLFDLNSTGGTFVNGQRVTRYNLNPGDVISLAGVPLIYGQDTPSDRREPPPGIPPGSTQSFPNPYSDRNRQKH